MRLLIQRGVLVGEHLGRNACPKKVMSLEEFESSGQVI